MSNESSSKSQKKDQTLKNNRGRSSFLIKIVKMQGICLAERIRIDCVSAANHDLIRLLDKPGVSAYSVYKKISFFKQRVGSAFLRSALKVG